MYTKNVLYLKRFIKPEGKYAYIIRFISLKLEMDKMKLKMY